MSKTSTTISNAERSAFMRAVRELIQKHPKFAGQVALAEIPPEPPDQELETPVLHIGISKTKTKQCVKWGVDPVSGNRVCLKWADVS